MGLFGTIKKKLFEAPKIKKRTFDPERMSIEDISIPDVLKRIDKDTIRDMIRDEMATFKSLNYVDTPLDQLKIKEYHSYQIGLILKYLKDNHVFAVPNIEKIIPAFVIGSSPRQLHIKVFDLVYRYDISVDKEFNIVDLKKDIRWSPLETAYLLYYLSLSNRAIPIKR